MIENKYINSIIAVLMVAAVLLTSAFMVSSAGLGVSAAANVPAYARKSFQKDQVMQIDIKVEQKDWDSMLENAAKEEYVSCDITVDGITYDSVGIRPKGNSSLNMVARDSTTNRFSFKLEFDHYIKEQTFMGLDKFVLNNVQADAAYMKEYLSYDLMQYIGVTTPLYAYANITVNGKPWGLYLAVEALEESFAQRNFGNDYGQLYKPEGMEMGGMGSQNAMQNMGGNAVPAGGQRNAQRGEGNNGQEQGAWPNRRSNGLQGNEQPNGNENNTNQVQRVRPDRGQMGNQGGMPGNGQKGGAVLTYTDDDIANYSSIFNNAVFNSTDTDYNRVIEAIKHLNNGTELEKYFDVEAVLRYFAANTVLVNLDSYASNMKHNYYLYEKDGKCTILPWDFNLSFAGFQTNNASTAINFPIDTPTTDSLDNSPLIGKLLEVPEYKELYHRYLQDIIENYFHNGVFDNKIDALHQMIGAYVEKDATAFYTYEQYQQALPVLKEFGRLRAQSIAGQLAGTIPSTTAGQSTASESLVNASAINLSALGSMGGGKGGIEGGNDRPGQGQDFMPGGQDGNMPDMNNMREVMQIIQSAQGKELTAEQKARLKELGIEDEMLEQMMNRAQEGPGGFFPGGQMPEGQDADGLKTPDAQGSTGKNTGTSNTLPSPVSPSRNITFLLISTAALAAGLLFVLTYKRKRYKPGWSR